MAQQEKKSSLVKTFFKGLINNDAVISGSKASKWWVGLIIGLVSAFLPVIPIMVSTANSNGASFLSGTTNGFEQYLASAVVDMHDVSHYEFEVNSDHQLDWYIDGEKQGDNANPKTPLFQYVSTRQAYVTNEETGETTIETYTQVEYEIYYSTDPTNDSSAEYTVSDLIDYLESESNYYELGTTTKYLDEEGNPDEEEGEDAPSVYAPSYTVLYKNGIYTSIKGYDSTTTSAYTSYTSDWTHTEVGTKLIEYTYTVEGYETANTKDSAYVDGVLDNWSVLYKQAYLTQKDFNLKFSTLIYTGIYIVLVFAMGVLLFLLTRGKRNMFNYLTFLDTQKMAWWEAVAPSLLSLILGFLFSSYAMMLFILLLGLRTMWMSMKQLRPQY